MADQEKHGGTSKDQHSESKGSQLLWGGAGGGANQGLYYSQECGCD